MAEKWGSMKGLIAGLLIGFLVGVWATKKYQVPPSPQLIKSIDIYHSRGLQPPTEKIGTCYVVPHGSTYELYWRRTQ